MTDPTGQVHIEHLTERLNGHDNRINAHDGKIQILSEQLAVVALRQGQMAEDLKELVGQLHDVTASMERRLGRLIAGVWAVAIVFIPIAYQALQSSGGG